jgi:hypothetical protein
MCLRLYVLPCIGKAGADKPELLSPKQKLKSQSNKVQIQPMLLSSMMVLHSFYSVCGSQVASWALPGRRNVASLPRMQNVQIYWAPRSGNALSDVAEAIGSTLHAGETEALKSRRYLVEVQSMPLMTLVVKHNFPRACSSQIVSWALPSMGRGT